MSEGFKLQYSAKTPGQFGGMLNIRADSLAEFDSALSAVLTTDVITKVNQIDAALSAAQALVQSGAVSAPQQPQAAPQAPQTVSYAQEQVAPVSVPPLAAQYGYCNCNPPQPRKRIEFTYKKGAQAGAKGAMYVCTKDRESQCDSKDFEGK